MTKKLFSIEKGTKVFIKKEKDKFWQLYTTTKPLTFLSEDYFEAFPVHDFLCFKRANWLIAAEDIYIKEEEFAEGYW